MLKFTENTKNKHHSFCPLEQNISKKPFFLSITPKNATKTNANLETEVEKIIKEQVKRSNITIK